MSSPAFFEPVDQAQRRLATEPAHSFTVQAPAGSGKTELLIQRYLRLLSVVQRPESIVAITFTRKAAGEMRDRIVAALHAAKVGEPVRKPHQSFTRELALAALEHDAALGWNLLDHPGRLRVQTIDALCTEIAASMPWLARLGAMPQIVDDVRPLYLEAARRTVLKLGGEHGASMEILLGHLDGEASQLCNLISSMLAVRDQWLDLAVQTGDQERALMEEALERTVLQTVAAADRLIPGALKGAWGHLAAFVGLRQTAEWPGHDQPEEWRALAEMVLTQKHEWRKQADRNLFGRGRENEKRLCLELLAELSYIKGLDKALKAISALPAIRYNDSQWQVMLALFDCLKIAVAELRHVFAEEGTIDFCEISIAARDALGSEDHPTDLAFRLHGRIEHLLIDEFQDTSTGQYNLVKKLIAEWQPDDSRTLFIVGDPMQSIYRFREAEVSLFMDAREHGIGSLTLEPLTLSANHRSVPAIVGRANKWFAGIFPAMADVALGGIPYASSVATEAESVKDLFALADQNDAISIDLFTDDLSNDDLSTDELSTKDLLTAKGALEAKRTIALIREARERDPEGSVAILVRARSHLFAIVEELKKANITYQAVEIDELQNRPAVQDLLALTRALLFPADRIAWLAVLRAPWCGLTLLDLEALVRGRESQTIWESLQSREGLTSDGAARVERVRDVFHEALQERGRWSLRRWVERVWIRLGGPACLEADAAALRDVTDFLDLLEAEQRASDIGDFDRFLERVRQLYAQPAENANQWLHVMTIHKAKGLEFDTVILPGLGQPGRSDDQKLFLFHQWKEGDRFERLLAPIPPKRGAADPIYDYLNGVEKQKGRYERARLLYVAVTRAKKRLHLLGQVKINKYGEPSAPGSSMLSDLWPRLTVEELQNIHYPAGVEKTNAAERPRTILRRLPASWAPPPEPRPMPWENEIRNTEQHEPTFEWVGETLRHTGTVVHAFLQRMVAGAALPNADAVKTALRHEGVVPSELASATERVRTALEKLQSDPRSRWIFGDHEELRREYAITGVVDGELVRGKVDRTFIDAEGVRWIIDYKTSSHEGGRLDEFLDEQQRRYCDQMERYARLFAPLGDPIRLGLYFPLVNGWREWAFLP
ncbi:MAG: UvrD-helicase domain-containing protein [Bryobacteraceae bacterium]